MKKMHDLAIMNGHVWLGGRWVKTNIYVQAGRITHLGPEVLPAESIEAADDACVIPGIIDPHVHFALTVGERTSVDDFYHGTKSAAFGGVTSIIDFLAPAHDVSELHAAYEARLLEAKGANIDYVFHACIASPRCDLETFIKSMLGLGLHSLKLFTTYSESDRRTREADIERLLLLTKRYPFLVTAHVEKDDRIDLDKSYTIHDLAIKARPVIAEHEEALVLAELVKKTNGRLYMVHTSSGKTIELLKEHYPSLLGTHFFLESCPQYFTFNSSVLQGADGSLFAFAPPLRDEEHRRLLIDDIDLVQTIGTDHCSFLKKDKRSSLLSELPLGVGGIESSFQIMHALFGDKIIDKMTKNVAQRFALKGKGEIKVGNDADFAIFKKEETLIGKPHGRCDYSIYEGMKSDVRITSTILRGRYVIRNGVFHEQKGQLIKEETA